MFIDKAKLEAIAAKDEGKATKVINLVKAIEKSAEEQSDDPFLVAMAERARVVQEAFEARQRTTEKALEDLMAGLEKPNIGLLSDEFFEDVRRMEKKNLRLEVTATLKEPATT